ncbi:MAG TPA: ribonuclease D [Chthoniobacterales bacterium]|nr:ribonuclease D [Chthoniobacterales bacterium]
MIANAAQLRELLPQLEPVARVAIDTEADSLHCYREKLCLLQISVSANRTDSSRGEPGYDFIVDPLADVDLAPLNVALADKEIVLHGADYDLRLLRRNMNFVPQQIFDTVIAARLIGIREFSLAALVQRYFGVELTKGSQKANWAQRPLSARMQEYAINDTRYLLALAERFEAELDQRGRREWFRQSCQRALELSATDRVRDLDEAWRISGAGVLPGRVAAILRELWQWREKEAEGADRPPFHILQNRELIGSAESFAAGNVPDFKHFSPRRRNAFRESAGRALQMPERDWPVKPRRSGTRPSAEVVRRVEELRCHRDRAAKDLDLEPFFIAPRATLEAIAADETRANELLVPWQRDALKL